MSIPSASIPITFPEIRVVEASAGSGKTYALAKRYVQLLMNLPDAKGILPGQDILAVTFTNKAAAQMKQRILDLFKKIALDQFRDDRQREDIYAGLQISCLDAQNRAVQCIESILSHFHYFQIHTIDAFIKTLVVSCAFRLELSSKVNIVSQSERYLQESFNMLIERQDVRHLFDAFLAHYLSVEQRTQWYPKEDILSLMKWFSSMAHTYPCAWTKGPYASAQLRAQKSQVAAHIRTLALHVPEGTHQRFAQWLSEFAHVHVEALSIDDISDYFMREQFPVKKGYTVPVETADLWRRIKEGLRQVCEAESSSLFNCYLDIFEEWRKELERLLKKENKILLEELQKKMQWLFDEDQVRVSELYLRLATRISHYLVDEFQDTSLLQWHNLAGLIEEALSSGGTFFYVGDKKQALYRFRGADARLFDAIKAQAQGNYPVITEQLFCNYRSQKAIVDFNNILFSRENLMQGIAALQGLKDEDDASRALLLSTEDTQEIVQCFAAPASVSLPTHQEGYVCIEELKTSDVHSDEDLIREKIITLLRSLSPRFFWGDIGILTRDNREVALLTQWCVEEGIPVASDNTMNIRQAGIIKELLCLLTFLDSPVDNLAFTGFVTGAVIRAIAPDCAKDIHAFLFSLRLKEKQYQGKQPLFYKEFQAQFPLVWAKYFEWFFKHVGLFPLYEYMIKIYAQFQLLEHFPHQQGFLMKLLELIKTKEEEYYSLSSFLHYCAHGPLEEFCVGTDAYSAVQIMTIHKAKGLEFGVVIIPFLELKVRVARDRACTVVMDQGRLCLRQLKRAYVQYSPLLQEEYRKAYKDALIDELNALYVACTRPCYELYGYISASGSKAWDNAIRFFISDPLRKRGTLAEYPLVQKTQTESGVSLPVSVYRDWGDLLQDEYTQESQLKNRTHIKRGEQMHCILSCVGNLSMQNKEEVFTHAFKMLKVQRYDEQDCPVAFEYFMQLVEDPNVRDFFYAGKEAEVYQEQAVVDDRGNTHMFDRLIVKKEEVMVIDYKSTRDACAAHQAQVREYMRILKRLYPKTLVRGYILYLDTISKEEVMHQ